MSLHSHSRLPVAAMAAGARAITRDSYTHATVYRDDELVADFQCRIAVANNAVMSADVQRAMGDASPGFYVALVSAQLAMDRVVRQGDELWTDGRRYRVVSVAAYPHEGQILLRHIQ